MRRASSTGWRCSRGSTTGSPVGCWCAPASTAGDQVIDLGCGGGDVALIAADVVGPAGAVVGVDRSPRRSPRPRPAPPIGRSCASSSAISTCGQPARAGGRRDRPLRAHAPGDPVALLARARRWVRRGGMVAFVESDNAACRPGVHSQPHSPTYQRIVDVWQATIRAAGAHLDMGTRLADAFIAAGLARPRRRGRHLHLGRSGVADLPLRGREPAQHGADGVGGRHPRARRRRDRLASRSGCATR